jgi:hypothetical protein
VAEIILFKKKQNLLKSREKLEKKNSFFIDFVDSFFYLQANLKCEKCGKPLTNSNPEKTKELLKNLYKFCDNCFKDYSDYINYLKGDLKDKHPFQNSAWVKLWQNWISYKGAADSYINSKEFLDAIHKKIVILTDNMED